MLHQHVDEVIAFDIRQFIELGGEARAADRRRARFNREVDLFAQGIVVNGFVVAETGGHYGSDAVQS